MITNERGKESGDKPQEQQFIYILELVIRHN